MRPLELTTVTFAGMDPRASGWNEVRGLDAIVAAGYASAGEFHQAKVLATAVAAGYASTGEHVQAKQDAAAQAASFESHAARWRHSTTRFQERQRQRRQ